MSFKRDRCGGAMLLLAWKKGDLGRRHATPGCEMDLGKRVRLRVGLITSVGRQGVAAWCVMRLGCGGTYTSSGGSRVTARNHR